MIGFSMARAAWPGVRVCVVIICFSAYFSLMLCAPLLCGWCDPPSHLICPNALYPHRTLLLSEFVFVELLGVAFIVGGVLILFHFNPWPRATASSEF
jgi:hypothetical protein